MLLEISTLAFPLLMFAGGPIFRLKGSILCLSFLDCNGALVPYSYEPWKDEGKRESKLKEV